MPQLNPSREIAFPFRIGQHGGIAYVEDPYRQAFQRMVVAILTSPGERVMLPTYGTPARGFLFQNIDEIGAAELATRIETGITRWEPGITVHEVMPDTERSSEGELRFTIKYSVPPEQTVLSTVVNVGGSITQGETTNG